MGEIADMMLDGTLCQSCGEYLGSSLGEFPQSCAGCRERTEETDEPQRPKSKTGIKNWRRRHRAELLGYVYRYGQDPTEENGRLLMEAAQAHYECRVMPMAGERKPAR